jgi:aspartyl-tRNA(Asn)/glutamyl-tRNA(Gln) amidotransferase subunit C
MLTQEEIKHIAHLACLELSPGEEAKMAQQASEILDYINLLQDLDTDDMEATFQVQPLVNVWREDEVKPSLGAEAVLSNAPQRDGDYFKMPRIL